MLVVRLCLLCSIRCAQIPVAMCLNLVHLLAVTMARPYAELSNTYMAIYADVTLFLTLFVSMLNKAIEEQEQGSQRNTTGLSKELILGVLFATSGSVLALSIVFLHKDFQRARKRTAGLLRYSGGTIVTLKRVAKGSFHLFLSVREPLLRWLAPSVTDLSVAWTFFVNSIRGPVDRIRCKRSRRSCSCWCPPWRCSW